MVLCSIFSATNQSMVFLVKILLVFLYTFSRTKQSITVLSTFFFFFPLFVWLFVFFSLYNNYVIYTWFCFWRKSRLSSVFCFFVFALSLLDFLSSGITKVRSNFLFFIYSTSSKKVSACQNLCSVWMLRKRRKTKRYTKFEFVSLLLMDLANGYSIQVKWA